VLHQIGVGALGPVFRTYEPTRDRLVAVKVFRLDVTPEQARALADELGRVTEGNLFHPSIVEPVAAGVEGTVAYRAEEYVAAESLDVAMRHYAPAALEKVLPFITQLASAIDFARQAGVGHGALHPRDIFVTPDEARATGFGVVDALDRLGLRAPVRRPYSPPERIAGERWGTPADVFSLGAIAFELITGRRPSGVGDQIGALTGANVGERADAIRAVLARAMREHPVERYSTAMEFASDLDRAAGQMMAAKIERPAATDLAPAASAVDEIADEITIAESVLADADAARADEGAEKIVAEDEDTFGLGLTLEDSPREVARKVIAAREVRKRQGQSKAKAHGRQEPDAAAVSLLVPPDPVPESLPDAVESTEPTAQFAEESTGPEASRLESPDDPSVLEVPLAADEKSSKQKDAAPRVVDVDDFRPREREREIDAFRAERPWPRPAERTDHLADLSLVDPPTPKPAEPTSFWSVEHPSARKAERPNSRGPEPPNSRPVDNAQGTSDAPEIVERVVMPKPTALEPFDPELPPPLPLRPTAEPPPPAPERQTADESAPAERPRIVMLPTAVGLILGLLAGYLAGYSVGSRDVTKQLAQQQPPSTVQSSGPSSTPPRAETPPPATLPSAPAASEPKRSEAPAVANESPRGGAAAPPATSAAKPSGGNTPPASAAKPPETAPSTSKPVASSTPPAAKPPAAAAAAPAAPRETRKAEDAATSGRIVVTSTPSRAAVTVNGHWSGRTPLTLPDQRFGKYVVRVVETGYTVARQEFVLSSSAPTKTIDVTLESLEAGRDAKPAAKPQSPPLVPPVPVESTPAAGAARGQTPPAGTGSIFVDSRPRGARVFVDGKEYGVTPTTVPNLPAGRHTVRLELADHAPWTTVASFGAGTTARVTGSLERIR
jgi:hypothetical protein